MKSKLLTALAALVIGAGTIFGATVYLTKANNDNGVTAATPAGEYTAPDGKKYPHYTLNMNTYPNSLFGGHHGAGGGAHPDWVSYGLGGPNGEILSDAKTGTNFVVPAHSAVTITIYQYDSGETLNNDFFSHVIGTVDGSATFVQRWDNKAMKNASAEHKITSIPHDAVGHTWTLHSVANKDKKDQIFVNVPLALANDDEVTAAEEAGGYTQFPTKTTFTFITGDEGEYIWNCEFPCGDGTVARFGNAMSSMSYMSGHFTVKA